jgi:hypothetical protein
MSEKTKQPAIDPATSQAFAKILIGNSNEPLKKGGWSVKGTRIISGNIFRVFNFGEQLIKHGVHVEDSLEAMKAATIALTPKIAPGGLRGEIENIMTQNNSKKEPTTAVYLNESPTKEGEE